MPQKALTHGLLAKNPAVRIDDNGVTKNVAHRRYFQEAIQGMQTISDPLESSVDQEIRVVLGMLGIGNQKILNGFMILDMDHFKEINDTFGHAVGDKVLQSFGALLQSQFRDLDVVGRIGGDEFVVILYDIGTRENMEKRVKGLQEKIREMEIPELQGHKLTSSAGIAFAPKDGNNFMELYRRADNALYQTKRSGRDGYSVHEKLQ